jgi:hypothetical protein
MTSRRFLGVLRCSAAVLLASCLFYPLVFAQGPLPDAPVPSTEAVSPVQVTPAGEIGEHRFWDKTNFSLFAVSTALSGADFAVTRANLQNGGRELNPVVRVFGRSGPGLALNFGGETAGVIALSYFFHKTHHHKLERMVSVANIAASAGAVSYGLAHR